MLYLYTVNCKPISIPPSMCVHSTPPPPKVLIQLALFNDLDYRPETYPKYKTPMIRSIGGQRVASLACFGLIPHWAKDASFGNKTYNARTETVHEKPSYRTPWAKRQFCLIPLMRYFEPCWETGKAVNWAIHRKDNEPFTVAAIWDTWTDKATGEIVESFSMLTINADGHPILGRMHRAGEEKRSLVVVNEDRRDAWLTATKETDPMTFCKPMDVSVFMAEPESASHLPHPQIF